MFQGSGIIPEITIRESELNRVGLGLLERPHNPDFFSKIWIFYLTSGFPHVIIITDKRKGDN